jgi:hypothetical protein
LGRGALCRTDLPLDVLFEILKSWGKHALEMRSVCKALKAIVDSLYFRLAERPLLRMAARGYYSEITADRLFRVRRILTGPDPSPGVSVVVWISLTSVSGGVKTYLDRFPCDKLDVRMDSDVTNIFIYEGDPPDHEPKRSTFHRYIVLRPHITRASFDDCILKKWHMRDIAKMLPRTLTGLSFHGCRITCPLDMLTKMLTKLRLLTHLDLSYVSYNGRLLTFDDVAPALKRMKLIDLGIGTRRN